MGWSSVILLCTKFALKLMPVYLYLAEIQNDRTSDSNPMERQTSLTRQLGIPRMQVRTVRAWGAWETQLPSRLISVASQKFVFIEYYSYTRDY